MFIKKRYIPIAFTLAIILSIVTILLFFQDLKLIKTVEEKPSDIVVANISSTSTKIYWKSNEGINCTLYYKEEGEPLYKPAYNSNLYRNIDKDNYVYEAILEDLQPNTKYSFSIHTPRKVWGDSLEFNTNPIDEKIELPNIEQGDTQVGSFLLLQSNHGNQMIYTQNSDSWAIDMRKEDYTVREYARYIPSAILMEQLQSVLLKFVSPVYAQSGANCKTNITKMDNQYYPKIDGVRDLLDRLIGGCKGHYTNECYNDVYCQSIEKGVNPALPLTLWVHESAGSMYAKYSDVEDFGIHGGGIPSRNFTSQLKHLLDVQMDDSYISGYCTDKGLSDEQRWATKYARGYCNDTNIVAGKKYITEIRTYYSWLKGSNFPSWPWNIPANSNACDRSKQVTNQVYRDCSGNPIGDNPDPGLECSGPDVIPGKDDILVGQTCKDIGGCECFKESIKPQNYFKDVACGKVCTDEVVDDRAKIDVTTEDKYCRDKKGCICYWNNRTVKKDAENYQTCTVDKEVIDTIKVCCLEDESMSSVYPYNCNGSIKENVPQNSCRVESFEYKLTEGINFVKAYNTVIEELVDINTAEGLIEYSKDKITTIASFNEGKWDKILEYKDGKIYGTNFPLDPKGIYLMLTTEDLSIQSSGYTINPESLELQELIGWNLIPTSIFYNNAEKAFSMFEDSKFDPVKQVAIWNKSVSMFEYTVENRDNSITGNNISLISQDSIFINVIK